MLDFVGIASNGIEFFFPFLDVPMFSISKEFHQKDIQRTKGTFFDGFSLLSITI
jgi:hypothetical protein